MTRLETLKSNLLTQFGEGAALTEALNELTLEVGADQWVDVCATLREQPALSFETCIDLCAVDYSAWGQPAFVQPAAEFPQRYAVVLHLISVKHNWRLRVRTWVGN